MNPTLPEVLNGNLAALSEPADEDNAGDFTVGKLTVIGLLSFLCAQEAETGAAVRHAENEAMRALFADAARGHWAPKLSGDLQQLAATWDQDFTLSGLDKANAELRRSFIRLHQDVESDTTPTGVDRQRRCLELLLDHARARELKLPGQPETS